jgi:hypothetical protein
LAALRAAQAVRDQQARAERKTRLDAIEKAEKWQAIVNALGGKLARHAEDDALAETFHRACDLLHKAEATVDGLYESLRRSHARDRKAAA